MAQNIALCAIYLTVFDMLGSMSFLLQFIAANSLRASLKPLAGSLSDLVSPLFMLHLEGEIRWF